MTKLTRGKKASDNSELANRYLSTISLTAVFGSILLISPIHSFDPINIPKLTFLFPITLALLAIILSNLVGRNRIWSKSSMIIVPILIICIILALSNEEVSLRQDLFGNFGRNRGLLFYFSLVILFVAGILISSVENIIQRLSIFTISVAIFQSSYSIIQKLDLDPFDWTRNESFGTLGNTNFLSAFLAIAFVWAMMEFRKSASTKNKLVALLASGSILVGIAFSDSLQGPIMIAISIYLAGCFTFGNRIVLARRRMQYVIAASLLTLSLGLVVFLGFIGLGPFGSILIEPTMQIRLDYWRAGLKMFLSSPYNGVGVDNYGYFYREFRATDSILRVGPNTVADSAHNVYLDYLANFGALPFILIFILDLLIVCYFLKNFLIRSSALNMDTVVLFIVFLIFTLQGLISIENVGLAPYLWLIKGILVTKLIRNLKQVTKVNEFQTRKRSGSLKSPGKRSLKIRIASGILVGSAVTLPLALNDARLLSAIRSADVKALNSVQESNFSLSTHLKYVGDAYIQLGQNDSAKKVVSKVLTLYPRDFDVWSVLANSSQYSEQERRAAFQRLIELDPKNPYLQR